MSKLLANPAPYTAFLAGILVFAPGLTFIAAIQVVATAKADLSETAVALAVVVAINVALVWLPLLTFLVAPEATARRLAAFNAWLRRHSHLILSVVLIAAGLIVAVSGLVGLIQKG